MTLSLFPTVGFYGVSANLKLWGSSEVSAGSSRPGPEEVRKRFPVPERFGNELGFQHTPLPVGDLDLSLFSMKSENE